MNVGHVGNSHHSQEHSSWENGGHPVEYKEDCPPQDAQPGHESGGDYHTLPIKHPEPHETVEPPVSEETEEPPAADESEEPAEVHDPCATKNECGEVEVPAEDDCPEDEEPVKEPGAEVPAEPQQPVTGQPAQPAQPGKEQPGTDKPITDKPGDKPGNDKPGNDKPGNDKPGNDKPGNDKPGNDKPGNDKPGVDRPGKPILPWPGVGKPEAPVQVGTPGGGVLPGAGTKPFAGQKLYVDPTYSKMVNDAAAKMSPADAAALKKLGEFPVSRFVGDMGSAEAAKEYIQAANKAGQVPVIQLYGIPNRDEGPEGFSSGGMKNQDEYLKMVRSLAEGIGDGKALIVMEPDALAQLDNLKTKGMQDERLDTLSKAIDILKKGENTKVYLDAGSPGWKPANVMADRLKQAGVAKADGFSLNVANYKSYGDNVAYGEQISQATGGKHFVIDSSRNGMQAPAPGKVINENAALGNRPTLDSKHPLVDGELWIKRVGESDGDANGAPKAGTFYPEYALKVVKNTPWLANGK